MPENDKIKKIILKSVEDDRGVLSVIEIKDFISWPVKRIYYVTDSVKPRGGHAVRNEKKIYICQKGSLRARLHDGNKWYEFFLNGPNEAIQMETFCYREFDQFSKDAVLLAISSVNYDSNDYIFDLKEFIKEANLN